MNVTAILTYDGSMCFTIVHDHAAYVNSLEISKLLGLDVNVYNKILIEKVIKHDQYQISR